LLAESLALPCFTATAAAPVYLCISLATVPELSQPNGGQNDPWRAFARQAPLTLSAGCQQRLQRGNQQSIHTPSDFVGFVK